LNVQNVLHHNASIVDEGEQVDVGVARRRRGRSGGVVDASSTTGAGQFGLALEETGARRRKA